MNLILLGAPGAGKGTQAEKICEKLRIPAVSTGGIFREAMAAGTPLGLQAQAYIHAGRLVPDEVVIGIVRGRLAQADCADGFVLDGFPRTVPQAEALDAMGVHIDRVIDIETPDEVIVARLSGRRVCPKCGATYHLQNKKPKTRGRCDLCGEELSLRKDDAPETVLERLRTYHEQTEPLKVYYEKKGLLAEIDGQAGVEETAARLFGALGV